MKERLKQILAADPSLSEGGGMAEYEFGLSREKHYDALVVAPGWRPDKIMADFPEVEITCTMRHSYLSGYEVKGEDFHLAWIQCSSGASSLIDELSTCVYLDVDKLIFVGAVGGLVPEVALGELYTPAWCVEGNLANGYLTEDILAYKPFGKVYPNDPAFVGRVMEMAANEGITIGRAPVFCTDSIICEYTHLDFIKSFGVKLIEMETSSFYRMADLMEKPAVALLAVSDNSANGDPLIARTEAQKVAYNVARRERIPRLILGIAKM